MDMKTIQHNRITDFIRNDADLVALYLMCVQVGTPSSDKEDINKLEEQHRGKTSYEDVVRNLST